VNVTSRDPTLSRHPVGLGLLWGVVIGGGPAIADVLNGAFREAAITFGVGFILGSLLLTFIGLRMQANRQRKRMSGDD
jgi:hypothetical protein